MKIPVEIRHKMHQAANNFRKGGCLMSIIDDWFESHGYPPELIRSGDGISLEELEYGNDITDQLCDLIESGGLKQ